MAVSVEEVAVLPVDLLKLVVLEEEVQEIVVLQEQQVELNLQMLLMEVMVALTLVVVAVLLLDGQLTETELEEQVVLELL